MTLLLRSLMMAVACPTLAGYALLAQIESSAAGEHRQTVAVGGLDRTYTVVVPKARAARPPVVIVLHGGSGGSGARIRGFIGREVEDLAERHGFLVAYPDGIEGSWNDCRAGASYGAKVRNIDDVAFIRALAQRVEGEFGADPRHVYAIGYSNGAHLAFRMAVEAPGVLRGIAAFAANVPATDGFACVEKGQPVSVLLVTGTADRINPFAGGEVALPNGTRLGRVRSADETLRYFGALAGHEGAPRPFPVQGMVESAGRATPDATPGAEARGWIGEGRPDVAQYIVPDGGHTIPSPVAQFPEFLGRTERRFSAVAAAIQFFGLTRPAS